MFFLSMLNKKVKRHFGYQTDEQLKPLSAFGTGRQMPFGHFAYPPADRRNGKL
jgi:hypothetical protein